MKRLLMLILCLLALRSFAAAQEQIPSPKTNSRAVTAAQINGLYRNGRNDFRILVVDQNTLRVQFNGEWITPAGDANIGAAAGEATIEGNIAVFIPGNAAKCRITMTFFTNGMKVDQEGLDSDCGFCQNVTSAGSYRRVRAGKPRFTAIPQ